MEHSKTMCRLTLCLVMACGLGATAARAQFYNFTTLAGIAGYGTADGVGSNARFNRPFGVATDSAGTIYVADSYNHIIRKITPDGVVSTVAGLAGASGSTDGIGSNARFNRPCGVTLDTAGMIYVADSYNHTLRKITPDGAVSTVAGLVGVSGSADGADARFFYPYGVAADTLGNVYVADCDNSTIRKITQDGVVSTLAGLAGYPGSADGVGSSARFRSPLGLAVDRAGNVYVADDGNSTIRKITPDGVVSTLAGRAGYTGSGDGTGSSAAFRYPYGVAADGVGTVYVADYVNCTIRKITPGAVVTTLAGLAQNSGSADGTGSAARFHFPSGVAVDPAGNVYVADDLNCTIRKITPGRVVTTLAGEAEGAYPGSADGAGSSARFYDPRGVAVDSSGNVYVTDSHNYTLRKISPEGVVSALAGLAGVSGSADGAGSSARFKGPEGIGMDSAGNIYVADVGSHTLRKVTPAGVVSTLAGLAGVSGSADGTGSSARFWYPYGVAVDRAGNVYVTDNRNYTLRKVTPAGVVSTLAGLAGYTGDTDGAGSNARFYDPKGIAVDLAGNVYVTDENAIRKITPTGGVGTLAGRALSFGSVDGPGSSARFNAPYGLAVDTAGNVYTAEFRNQTIRKITPGGMVSTLAGVTLITGAVDGLSSSARFNWPAGIAVDSRGRLYVADAGNNTIRVGAVVLPPISFRAAANQLVLSWPQAAGSCVVEASSTLGPAAVWTPLANPAGTSGNSFFLTNTLDGGTRFYRLRTP